ncbi:alpha/beta fold hydrolase [Actinoplanes sp. NPDC051859]|uniref:alpha/beta fold hydrolase n=1 Tax=Actinoplanes sp. NPDC051859 TaxID=3363909 RepID=UPI0037A99145
MSTSQWTADSAGSGEYADVNGINLYYETYGTGSPLVLLHGGLGSGEMFGPLIGTFAEQHRVILVDLQGHGRTADVERPLSIETMADDVAALIDHLGLQQPDVVGYSLGGGVALLTAIRHPEKVGRLVSASAGIRRSATYPEILEQQGQVTGAAAEFMKETPMYELYQRVAPRPEDFPKLLDKIGEAMAKDFDYTEEVRGLRVPTLIMGADADLVPPSHFVEIFALLGGGARDAGWMGEGRPEGGHALAILPGLTHYNLFLSPLFAQTTLAFLAQEK